jgi:hypothetical protein
MERPLDSGNAITGFGGSEGSTLMFALSEKAYIRFSYGKSGPGRAIQTDEQFCRVNTSPTTNVKPTSFTKLPGIGP